MTSHVNILTYPTNKHLLGSGTYSIKQARLPSVNSFESFTHIARCSIINYCEYLNE